MFRSSTRIAFAGLVIGIILLLVALHGVDISELQDSLAHAKAWTAAPFLAALFLFCWIKAIRWRLLLRPVGDVPASKLFGPILIGYAGTAIVPMHLGEVARAYVAGRVLNISVASTFMSIAFERVLDLLTLIIILALAIAGGTGLPDIFRPTGFVLFGISVAGLIALAYYAHYPNRIARMARILLKPLPEKHKAKLSDMLVAGSEGLGTMRDPGRYISLVLISSVQWSCMFVCTWAALAAFDISLHWSAILMLVGTTTLSMLIPAGPAFIGSMQLAFVLTLRPFGIEEVDALAASFFYQILMFIPLVLSGIVAAHFLGIALGELRAEFVKRDPPND